jgi:hypothetical protein
LALDGERVLIVGDGEGWDYLHRGDVVDIVIELEGTLSRVVIDG